jgi:hypothetical protein
MREEREPQIGGTGVLWGLRKAGKSSWRVWEARKGRGARGDRVDLNHMGQSRFTRLCGRACCGISVAGASRMGRMVAMRVQGLMRQYAIYSSNFRFIG